MILCVVSVMSGCSVMCAYVFTASSSIQAVCQAGQVRRVFSLASLLASDQFGSMVVVGSWLSEKK